MKVTLYSRNGKAYETVECEEVQPYCGDFKMVVLKNSPLHKIIGTGPTAGFVTNLPFVVDGQIYGGREPEPTEPFFTVKMLNDAGEVIQAWPNSQGLSFLREMISFKMDGQWYTVNGSVIVLFDEICEGKG